MKKCVETYARVGGYPKGYPFGYSPIWGFFGPFLSPDHSLFLFDPMIVFIIVFAIYNWRSITICRRFVIMSAFSSLIGISLLYSISYYWNGGGNWGPRHHLVPVELLCLLGFAFCACNFIHYQTFKKLIIVLGIALATVCQAISLPIRAGLEVFQFIDGDPLRVIPVMRIRNLLYLITGTVPDYDDPDIEFIIRTIGTLGSPDLLLFFRISHSLSFVPSSAILIAWTLLVTITVFVISVIVLRGFLCSSAGNAVAA